MKKHYDKRNEFFSLHDDHYHIFFKNDFFDEIIFFEKNIIFLQ
jgi:hypothetical protein